MPRKSMTWDAAADAKLFALIMQCYEIKVGGQNLARINVAMGLEPKSQAVTHRIGSLKKTASLPVAGASTTDDIKPITPRSRPKKATPKKRKDSVMEDDEFAEPKLEFVDEGLSTAETTPFYDGGTKKRKASSSPDKARTKFAKKLQGEEEENFVKEEEEEEEEELDPYDVSEEFLV
ncbi:hypothetical protein BKA81DRAFT_408096 [Phyllosticta paracitricarpa]